MIGFNPSRFFKTETPMAFLAGRGVTLGHIPDFPVIIFP